MRPTQAMVLSAGLGVRMRPLTLLQPKPALPVLNKPLIAHTLDHLAKHGVQRVVINTHHLPDRLEQSVARWGPAALEVTFSNESAILGTAGGLKKAARHFGDGPLYLVNSDSMTDADLEVAAHAHATSGRLATLVVRTHDPSSGYRPVMVAEPRSGTGRIVGIAGRRWGDGVACTFTGVHVIEPDVLDAIPREGNFDINADIYTRLLDGNCEAVGAWMHGGWWFEVGNPSQYLDLNLRMLERIGCRRVVGPDFHEHEDSRVEGCVIGAGVRVERGATIERSVIWSNVLVGRGVSIGGCVVTEGVELAAGAVHRASIIRQGEDGALVVDPLAGS